MTASAIQHADISRRTAIQAGAIGVLGLGMNHATALRAADRTTVAKGSGRAKSVIFIFLSGGLTKPDAPVGIRGEFSPVATRTTGVRICEHLPMLAARSEKWSLIRSLTTPYNEHSQGHMAILSGRTQMAPGFNPSRPEPGDHPSIASIASVVGASVPARTNNLPPAVVLPERLVHRTGRVIPGQFGGQMGARRDPWFIEASPFNSRSYGAYPDYEFHFVRGRERNSALRFQAPNLSLPQGLTKAQLSQRGGLRSILERQRRGLDQSASLESFDRHRQAAISLLTDSRVQRAFDVESADPRVLERYGRNAFGWSLLMARQLIEAGVTLVQLNLGNNETWDTHENNFPLLKNCLLPPTDRGVSALIDDLDARGLLDETLIVMCGEMGRTPKISPITAGGKNASGEVFTPGRHHWGDVFPCFFAGGGVRPGDRPDGQGRRSPGDGGLHSRRPRRDDLPPDGHRPEQRVPRRPTATVPFLTGNADPWAGRIGSRAKFRSRDWVEHRLFACRQNILNGELYHAASRSLSHVSPLTAARTAGRHTRR